MDEEQNVFETRPPRRGYAGGAVVALAVAIGATVWAYVEYVGAARVSLLALALAAVCFGVAFTILLAFRSAFAFSTVQAPRPTPTPTEAPVDFGVGARRGFVALLGTAAASLVAIVLLPLRSLGGAPRPTLHATAWRRGVRLLTVDGAPLRPQDLAPGSATPVVASTAPDDANSIAVLVRLRGSPTPRAYSRICTHSGCAVSMFRRAESQLVCPCHYSVFDAANGGEILSGPVSQALPELPLTVDADGFLVADGDFDRPIGPRCG